MNYDVISIRSRSSRIPGEGGLSFVEGGRDIPFEIRRMYWIYEVEAGKHRGFHAHKQNQQLLVCPYGKIELILDDGKERETVILDSPDKGLILYPDLWREMIWRQTGSILCVATSEYYDEEEYIRNYDEFLAYIGQKRK